MGSTVLEDDGAHFGLATSGMVSTIPAKNSPFTKLDTLEDDLYTTASGRADSEAAAAAPWEWMDMLRDNNSDNNHKSDIWAAQFDENDASPLAPPESADATYDLATANFDSKPEINTKWDFWKNM